MTPAEAVDLVTRFTKARMIAYERSEDLSVWERDQNKRSGLPAIAALAYLRANPARVPDAFRQVIDDGLAQTRVAEPLGALVADLGKRVHP